MKSIKIDRSGHLCDEPATGHNRWHPGLQPMLEVEEGEEVALETRDAADGYLAPGTTVADFATFPAGAIHPLTGPVLVKGCFHPTRAPQFLLPAPPQRPDSARSRPERTVATST